MDKSSFKKSLTLKNRAKPPNSEGKKLAKLIRPLASCGDTDGAATGNGWVWGGKSFKM